MTGIQNTARRRLLLDPTILVLMLASGAAAGALLFHQSRIHSHIVEFTVLQNAARYSEALREFRTLYSSEVVQAVAAHGIEVSHDYKSKDGAIPLPATLSMLLGNQLAKSGSGGRTRLYSPYPFPWRQDTGGLRDDFGRQAWEALSGNPSEPFFRFHALDGKQVLRYASADLMRASCVECHNTHPDSPKTDWKVGEVRGIVEVVLPLDLAIAQTQAYARESLVLFGGVVALGLMCVVLVIRNLRRTTIDLERRVVRRTSELEASTQELGRTNASLRRQSTKRKQAEHELSKLSVAVEQSPAAVVITDTSGAIEYVNPRFAEMTGYTAEEVTGRNPRLLKSGDMSPDAYAQMWATILRGEVWRGEFHNKKKNGDLYWEAASISPIRDEGGRTTHYLAVKEDITQRKAAEEERLRLIEVEHERSQLKEAVAAHDQLLGVVGHELRTPLAALRITTELLLTEEARQMPEWDSMVRSVNSEVIRMSNLVNDLLEAARLNSGTARWNWGTVDLQEVCQTALDQICPLVDTAKVELGCCVVPADLTMNGDADAIRRLVLNLVSNAQKFTEAGSIRVSVRPRADLDDADVEIAIRDTGVGIAPDVAKKLGTAFALNAGIVGSSHVKGSGLGIAICKGIIAAHGGTMTITSARGRGTCAVVRLRADLIEPVSDADELRIKQEIDA